MTTASIVKHALLSQALCINFTKAAQCKYPLHLLALWCTPADESVCPVFNQASGGTLEYHKLCCNPKYRDIWEVSYANKLGRVIK
eukprot:7921209-Ditylum_brightwellii.AAC.1